MTGAPPYEFVQHVVVFLVAIAAAFVVLRKVLGVFEARQSGQSPGPGAHAASPACGHCAAGNAAMKKLERG